ncbi:MAG: endonuclease III [Bacteroidia bacterium]|nr:endonuclease III [Bacteroidia bacterium]
MDNKEKIQLVLQRLGKVIPVPETELVFTNPFELLVSVILSAQCTDKRVNMVTPALFDAFGSIDKMADASFDDLFPFVKSISYPNSKARHLIETAKILKNKHNSLIPREYDELLKLPGVGRKTANVMNSVLYREPRMAVDTHVFRVSNRIGIAKGKIPYDIEKQLTADIPESQIPDAHHYLILHGRYTCIARNPKCKECPLTDICDEFLTKSADLGL